MKWKNHMQREYSHIVISFGSMEINKFVNFALAKLHSSEVPIQIVWYLRISISTNEPIQSRCLDNPRYILSESIAWMREIVIPVSTKWHRLLSFKWSWTYFEQAMCFYIATFCGLTSVESKRQTKNCNSL